MSRTGSRTQPAASGIGKGTVAPVSPRPRGETSANASANVTPSKPPEESGERAEEKKSAAGNVAVYCRFRPLNEKETAMGEQ